MEEDNVVRFPGVEELPEQILGPEVDLNAVLDGVREMDLDDVIVIGTRGGTEEVYFASTSGDPAKILWDLESAKYILMSNFHN